MHCRRWSADHARDHGHSRLCYCSGVVETRPLASFQAAGFREMVDINVTAALELAKAVSRRDVMTEPAGRCSLRRFTARSACPAG